MVTLKKIVRSNFIRFLGVWAVTLYARFYTLVGRCTVHNREVLDSMIEQGKPFIICFWHSRILMFHFAWTYPVKVHILISRHRDGRLIARIAANFGFDSIAGSSSKGGTQALRAIMRVLKDGDCVAITPDGPRGPRMRVSPGTIHTARMAGVPLLPVAICASRRHIVNSWDRFVLPLPFSNFAVSVGEPMEVARDADEATVEAARLRLEEQMNDLTRRLEESLGQTPVEPAPPADEPALQAAGEG